MTEKITIPEMINELRQDFSNKLLKIKLPSKRAKFYISDLYTGSNNFNVFDFDNRKKKIYVSKIEWIEWHDWDFEFLFEIQNEPEYFFGIKNKIICSDGNFILNRKNLKNFLKFSSKLSKDKTKIPNFGYYKDSTVQNAVSIGHIFLTIKKMNSLIRIFKKYMPDVFDELGL